MSSLAYAAPTLAVSARDRTDVDLAAVRQGEAGAHAAFYRAYAATVHGIALAVVGRVDADDVTQEVFVKALRGLGELRDDHAVGPWLCEMARNAARDHLRRRKRRTASSLESEPAAPTDADGELAERVLALVRSLPEAYRETLILRLVEGLSGPEIAERTGLTHGSVRVNLHRGMSLLRPLLEAEGWA